MSRTSPFKTLTPSLANGRESAAMVRILLRQRARRIESREHFERIVAQASHPTEVRRLLEPLLRPNLPCCRPSSEDDQLHTEGCPNRPKEMSDAATTG